MKYLAAAAIAALAVAAPAAAQHGSFEGTRVSVFEPATIIPSSQPILIRHGWVTGDWRTEWAQAGAAERQEFRSDVWRFELWVSVNGDAPMRVELDSTMHATAVTAGPAMLTMEKIFFIELAAGTFAPGSTVVFTGRWYGDSDMDDVSELELERTRTVTFS